jgi:hypothetical protein
MKRLVLVLMVAACGGKSAAPAEPASNTGEPAAATTATADPECMANCANEGPADEGGHFIYGAESEQSWTDVPAAQQQSECTTYCTASAEPGEGEGTGMALDEANGTH